MVGWMRLLLLGGVIMTFPQPASAQVFTPRPARTTAGILLGLGGGPGDASAFGVSATLATPLGLFTGRLASVFETFPVFPGRVPVEANSDLGVLYGWQIGWGTGARAKPQPAGLLSKYVTLAASMGIARTAFVRQGDFIREHGGYLYYYLEYEREVEYVVGVPYEVRLMLGGKTVGLGMSLFGNINRVHPYRGFFFNFFFGKRA